MKLVTELLIVMFTAMIVGGMFSFLMFFQSYSFTYILVSVGLWGLCGLLFKVNLVCDDYLKNKNKNNESK
jgi:hypothetical protein